MPLRNCNEDYVRVVRLLVWIAVVGLVVLVGVAVLGPSLPDGNPLNGLGAGLRDVGSGIGNSLGDLGRGIGNTLGGFGD